MLPSGSAVMRRTGAAMSGIRVGMAIVALLGLGALGCGGSDDTSAKAADDTLVIALPSQPENLNPIAGDNLYGGNQKFFNGLLRYAKDLTAVPDLARAMPRRSADGRTVTVRIRDDVTFHDGTGLTAKDVAFTYNAILDPDSAAPMATPLDTLDRAIAVDATTVRFDLNRPDPAFFDKLQVGIVPAAALAGRDIKTAAFNRKPIGTGPYVLKEFQPGGRIVMEANPRYFRGAPKIKRIVLAAVQEENARVALLEKGTVDAAGIVPKLADRVRRNGNYSVFEVRTADARVLALPSVHPVLRDRAVRRALSYAVDREKIVDSALTGAGEPAYGPIMKGHWAYSPASEVEFDPARAGRLLDAAGWTRRGDTTRTKGGRRLSFTLMYPSNDSVRKDIALAFTAQMKAIGVDVNLEGLTFDVIEKRQDTGATEFGYGTPYDPDVELYTLFHSRFAADGDSFSNPTRTRNAAIDAALEAERATLDAGERKEHFVTLQEELARDASWLWLVRLRHISVVSKRVKGVDPQVEPHAHGFSRGTSWNLEDWSLAPRS
jgi:peptide/nickel transport system substrate-binding protein